MKKNISYALQCLAFVRWTINRFHLYGPVQSYLIKVGVILIGSVLEGICHDYLVEVCRIHYRQVPKKFKKKIERMRKHGFDTTLCDHMNVVREKRDNVHLQRVKDLENDMYLAKDWHFAMRTLESVRKEYEWNAI